MQVYAMNVYKFVLLFPRLGNIQQHVFSSFRRYCFTTKTIPTELYVKLYDIVNGAVHVDDLFPYYLEHAREMYPHLTCMNDLKKISDLTTPASWYPDARKKQRKIVFHAGPTNSGKTYQAMQRFLQAKSGVYCGPLKLLAVEVFNKSNEQVPTNCHKLITTRAKNRDEWGRSLEVNART